MITIGSKQCFVSACNVSEEPHVDPTTNAAPVTETAEDGGEAVNIDGQAIFEEEQEGDEADETASVKDQRNIVEEIRQAEQEREKTGAVKLSRKI